MKLFTGLSVDTTQGSLALEVDSYEIDDADSYPARWRQAGQWHFDS